MKRLMKWALVPVVVLAAAVATSPSQAEAQWGVSVGSGGFGAYAGGFAPAGYGYYGGYPAPVAPYASYYAAPSVGYVQPNTAYRPYGFGGGYYGGGYYPHHHHHHHGW
jgi:hypothetical protein